MNYLLDTHTWIWWHSQPQMLSEKVKKLIAKPSHYKSILLASISLWEFCKLIQKGRLQISCSAEDWMRQALDMPKLQVISLTPEIAYQSTVLPEPIHQDPADQIIVATAREENAVILSKDQRILSYSHVKSLW